VSVYAQNVVIYVEQDNVTDYNSRMEGVKFSDHLKNVAGFPGSNFKRNLQKV
jgi:hypothetical protein